MRKTKNTIKINGHTYDAITGELLSGRATPSQSTQPAQSVTAGNVVKPTEPIRTAPTKMHPKAASHVAKKSVARQAAKAASRSPQNSKTLMRHSVSKPSHAANSHDKTHVRKTSALAKTGAVIAIKKSARRIDEGRLSQAKNITKSPAIRKFNKTTPTAHVPAHKKPHHAEQAHVQHHVTTTHPRRTIHKPTHHRQKTSADILQEALHHASSHKQKAPRHRLSRSQQVMGMSALVVTTGLLLAFVAVQSTPKIKMKVASAKAGFAASLPGNSPAGFHLGEMQYGAGAVALSYKSNSDETRKFNITQKTSSWDSTTLRDTVVAPADRDFRTVEDGGLTIYLYGQNNATWVDQGIWYQVQGNGSLSDRQLVDIAQSL